MLLQKHLPEALSGGKRQDPDYSVLPLMFIFREEISTNMCLGLQGGQPRVVTLSEVPAHAPKDRSV